jgi:hypothetical protein
MVCQLIARQRYMHRNAAAQEEMRTGITYDVLSGMVLHCAGGPPDRALLLRMLGLALERDYEQGPRAQVRCYADI